MALEGNIPALNIIPTTQEQFLNSLTEALWLEKKNQHGMCVHLGECER